MQYLGEDKYEIFIGERYITFTYSEIINFLQDTKTYLEKMDCVYIHDFSLKDILNDLQNTYKDKVLENNNKDYKIAKRTSNLKKINRKKQRGYNPNSKIKQLFKKYYDDTKTKKEVFTQISKELKISFKAVEKAFYLN